MKVRCTITLGEESFEFLREHSFVGLHWEGRMNATSKMLVCPACSCIWAEIEIDGSLRWPVGEYCERCPIVGEWNPVPGSLLSEEGYGLIDEELLKALPEPLLRREWRLHLAQLDRGTGK